MYTLKPLYPSCEIRNSQATRFHLCVTRLLAIQGISFLAFPPQVKVPSAPLGIISDIWLITVRGLLSTSHELREELRIWNQPVSQWKQGKTPAMLHRLSTEGRTSSSDIHLRSQMKPVKNGSTCADFGEAQGIFFSQTVINQISDKMLRGAEGISI